MMARYVFHLGIGATCLKPEIIALWLHLNTLPEEKGEQYLLKSWLSLVDTQDLLSKTVLQIC